MTLRSIFTLNLRACTIKAKPRLAEVHMTGVMLMAGLVLLSNPETFTLPPYVVVSQIASQTTWGTIMVGTGALRVVVILLNGSWDKTPHLRWFFSVISALVWAVMLAGLMAFSVPLQIGPFILWAIIVELVNAFRTARDARTEDESEAQDGAK